MTEDAKPSPVSVAENVEKAPPSSDVPEQKPAGVPLWTLIRTGTDEQVRQRWSDEVLRVALNHAVLDRYHCLCLMELDDSINDYDLDQVFDSLNENNANKEKDVLLILLSKGGSIEPAYLLSKLCKTFAKQKFIAVVPRKAKSAATLIALGADEIHIGPLGQLGPIDPQLGGLPALGVNQALRTIAGLSQEFPGSANMFATYLRMALTVEQIGYCDRISESAEQYAVRLLSDKPKLEKRAQAIAHELVHEYKDHDFVIDLKEARQHLGEDWIKTGTPELTFAEEVYGLFELFNYGLRRQKKRLLVVGSLASGGLIMTNK